MGLTDMGRPPALRAAAVLLLMAGLAGCTPGMYKRDVKVDIEGPSQIMVGQSVLLTAARATPS